MVTDTFTIYLLAAVCLGLAALRAEPARVNLLALGLLLWLLPALINAAPAG